MTVTFNNSLVTGVCVTDGRYQWLRAAGPLIPVTVKEALVTVFTFVLVTNDLSKVTVSFDARYRCVVKGNDFIWYSLPMCIKR